MSETILVIGYGPVGPETAALLAARGANVKVGQRKRPSHLPPGIAFAACDVTDRASLRAAAEGATQIVLSIGLTYSGKIWRALWPKIMGNLVEVAAATEARAVFADNLYMYGPQRATLTEDMPLSDYGLKPAARAETTRIWQEASAAGRIRLAALRAPDFYGPGVTLSVLGDTGLAALARGKSAMWIGDADIPHEIAYVPDVARAIVTLLDAPDDAFGQAWHVPCAPTRTPRELLTLGAAALGVPCRVRNLPLWALGALGVFTPVLREFSEMSFCWDRPYQVDSGKFAQAFWADATPFEVGIPASALSFRARAEAA
jgi:nucleoside-diphosphate-sugar epimerase